MVFELKAYKFHNFSHWNHFINSFNFETVHYFFDSNSLINNKINEVFCKFTPRFLNLPHSIPIFFSIDRLEEIVEYQI